jgi:hypothetical protein
MTNMTRKLNACRPAAHGPVGAVRQITEWVLGCTHTEQTHKMANCALFADPNLFTTRHGPIPCTQGRAGQGRAGATSHAMQPVSLLSSGAPQQENPLSVV